MSGGPASQSLMEAPRSASKYGAVIQRIIPGASAIASRGIDYSAAEMSRIIEFLERAADAGSEAIVEVGHRTADPN
jgi:hypothetical protein